MTLRVPDERGEEEMAGESRRRPAAAVGGVAPTHPAVRRIDRVEATVEGLLEHAAVADDGRELEQVPAVECPEPPERRPQPPRRGAAQARAVGAVRRPGESGTRRPRPR